VLQMMWLVQNKRESRMSFSTAISTVLSNYANFRGRATRSEYWYWSLFYIILEAVMMAVNGVARHIPLIDLVVSAGVFVIIVALFIPTLAVGIRRLHDIDRSAWWLLIGLIPFGGLVLLVFFCLPGTPGANRFGGSSFGASGPMPMPVGFN